MVLVEFMYIGRYQLMLSNCILISVFCIVLDVLFSFFLIEHDIVLAYLLVYYDNVLVCGGIKIGTSVLLICLIKSLRARNITYYAKVFK